MELRQTRHEDGKLATEGRFIKGKPHGFQMGWYSNGKPQHAIYYDMGVKNGEHLEWYDNGKQKVKAYFVDGKLHNTRTEFYPNGRIRASGRYEFGVPVGAHTFMNEDGKIGARKSYYKPSAQYPVGMYTQDIYKGYKVVKRGTFLNGKPHGLMTFYKDDGKALIKTISYHHGIAHGPYAEYNGAIYPTETGMLVNGKKSGEVRYYGDPRKPRNVTKTAFFVRGEEIKE